MWLHIIIYTQIQFHFHTSIPSFVSNRNIQTITPTTMTTRQHNCIIKNRLKLCDNVNGKFRMFALPSAVFFLILFLFFEFVSISLHIHTNCRAVTSMVVVRWFLKLRYLFSMPLTKYLTPLYPLYLIFAIAVTKYNDAQTQLNISLLFHTLTQFSSLDGDVNTVEFVYLSKW